MGKLFAILLSGTLISCTSVVVPNTKMCVVAGVMIGGAQCAYSDPEDNRIENLSFEELVQLLEGTPASETAPAIEAALIIPAEDFKNLKTAMEQACQKLKAACSKETRQKLEQVSAKIDDLQKRVAAKKKRKG